MLEELTPEQEALCEKVAEEYIADLTLPTKPDLAIIKKWLKIAYGLFEKPLPERIEISDSPTAALALASTLAGHKEDSLDNCGIGDGGWVSFYDYWHRAGIITDEEATDLLALRDYMRVAWDTVLLDECAIVIRRPVAVLLDDAGNLHSPTGPCLEWADGTTEYAWHGTWVPERTILTPKSHTREEYLAITNTEQRRALSESAGWPWVGTILGSTAIDTWIDPATALAYALLKCGDGTLLLQKQSPPLKDGTQPLYCEPVHEALRTARAARKWQATRLGVEECEADPVLDFSIEA